MMLLLLAGAALASDASPPTVTYQAPLGYPPVALELPLPPLICDVEVDLSATGEVLRTAGACPAPFAKQAHLDLQRWRFDPALLEGVAIPSRFHLALRYTNRETPPPDRHQWQWTDDALVRLTAQDRTMAWGGAGVALVGAGTASLALMTNTFDSYRAQAIAFGLGLTSAVIGAMFAAVHFGEARKRKLQRQLWADYRP